MFLRKWNVFGIPLAPLIAPFERQIQTLAVLHFVFLWILLPLISVWLPIYIFCFTQLWWVIPLYIAWTAYDWKRPRIGSRCWTWYKTHPIWHYFADYFPLRLIKTANLSPEKNYIIGSHPHGVLSVGAFTSMLTDATGFPSMFPGIKSTILTLNGQFYFPFRRDFGIALGGAESSRDSLKYLLENPGKGRAIAIVVGGATEALDAHPGQHDLNLLSRRGFCKFAIMHGADLVPMYNFGENDIYHQMPNPRGSRLREIQQQIKSLAGFCPPLFSGRGIFNRSFGILPHRRPITSVMGKPIPVSRHENPTESMIDALHSNYCRELIDLFERHKHLHNIPEDVRLNLY